MWIEILLDCRYQIKIIQTLKHLISTSMETLVWTQPLTTDMYSLIGLCFIPNRFQTKSKSIRPNSFNRKMLTVDFHAKKVNIVRLTLFWSSVNS